MKRSTIKDRDIKKDSFSVKPLNERESKMDTRKGMKRNHGHTLPEAKQILIFDNSQRNRNGSLPEHSL